MRPPRSERFVAGDPLRGLAALGVLIYHTVLFPMVWLGLVSTGFGGLSLPGHIIQQFELSVPTFFALSAYLIGRPFIHAVVFGDPLPGVRNYARRRLLRIVPAYWVVCGAVVLIGGRRGSSWGQTAEIFGFVQNYEPLSKVQEPLGQAWTIDVEMAFYVIVPLAIWLFSVIARRLKPEGRLVLLLVGLGGTFLLSVYARGHPVGTTVTQSWVMNPASMWFSFAPGLAIAALEIPVRPWITANLGRAQVLRLVLGLGSAACVGVYIALGHWSGPPLILREAIGKRTFFEAAGIALMVAAVLVRQWSGHGTARWLNFGWQHWLGKVSLSFYLVHQGVIFAMAGLISADMSLWAAFGTTLAITLPVTALAAALLYKFVEAPAMARKPPHHAPAVLVATENA